MTKPVISIISGTRDRPASFARFLKSLVEHTELDHEVIIADASEGQQYVWEPKPVRQRVGWQRIHEKPALGTLRGYNAAFRLATGTYLAFFNDDTEFLPGWDREAVEQMNAHPEVAMGIIYFNDKANGIVKDRFFEFQSFYDVPVPNFGFVRREIGEKIGWFDETLGRMYGCDTDFGLQMLVDGYGVMPLWGCRVLHHREMDKQRSENMHRIREDRAAFDKKWNGRKAEVKAAYQPWMHLLKPSKCE